MPVGPVSMRPPAFLKKWWELLSVRYFFAFFLTVDGLAIAPAVLRGQMPSTPSVPIESIVISWLAIVDARTNCWFRPPAPLPRTRTVVSPVAM